MNSERLHIVVLFGGQSTEHEVSILSARNVIAALQRDRYIVTPVYITETGAWYALQDDDSWLKQAPQTLVAQGHTERLVLLPGQPSLPFVAMSDGKTYACDCVIPMLHGTLGEDGAPQGLLAMLGIPMVGSELLASVLCMSKHITKQMLRAANIATTDWVTLTAGEATEERITEIVKQQGLPLFVKPDNLGSSVGMNKVTTLEKLYPAIEEALRYSDKILLESCIEGREIECAVLGNQLAESTVPGEVIPHHEFYTYAAKYLEPEGQGATLVTPADLTEDLITHFKQIAVRAFQTLHCRGMARVDFFLTKTGDILVNEVNTIPGFTNTSMYPRLWQHSGVSYAELLNKLIDLALTQHQQAQSLVRIYRPAITSSTSSSATVDTAE